MKLKKGLSFSLLLWLAGDKKPKEPLQVCSTGRLVFGGACRREWRLCTSRREQKWSKLMLVPVAEVPMKRAAGSAGSDVNGVGSGGNGF